MKKYPERCFQSCFMSFFSDASQQIQSLELDEEEFQLCASIIVSTLKAMGYQENQQSSIT